MFLLKCALAGFAIYVALLALMYAAQRRLMYFPETVRIAPSAAGLSQATEVVLDTSDGERVIAWHIPPADGAKVVVYFQGNGGALRYRAQRFATVSATGIGIVALSYRGDGGSTGTPSETGLLRDAAAAYDFAAGRYGASRIVLWGESLGTGVAVAVAAERAAAGLILESPFSSTLDIAAAAYPFVPVRFLMKDTFRSDLRIGRVTMPVLVLQGEHDRIVPNALGDRLYALIQAPKQRVRFPDGDHNNLDAHGAVEAVVAFVGRLGSSQP